MRKWTFPLLSAVAATVVSLTVYADLPERMALHFSGSGSPDNWGGKPFGAFALPVLILLLSALIIFSVKLEKDENKRRRTEASIGAIAAVVSAVLLAVHLFIVAYNLGYDLSAAHFAAVIVGILFILMGNMAPRLTQGPLQWPKLPKHIMRKAFRFQGRVMLVLGFAFILLAWLPQSYILPAFFGLIVLFILITGGSIMFFARAR
ncbi:hypothetical protein IJ21_00470 [Paenibacillus sp. 32O-W]|nr:DUF1648 domain-containing protein [Paenibacillus sp. 32O-W]ALS25502.1 hypothetical protein IJ21_00470 [Paenibacillus sp. 32O-W]